MRWRVERGRDETEGLRGEANRGRGGREKADRRRGRSDEGLTLETSALPFYLMVV